jgi:hypothetical protein
MMQEASYAEIHRYTSETHDTAALLEEAAADLRKQGRENYVFALGLRILDKGMELLVYTPYIPEDSSLDK